MGSTDLDDVLEGLSLDLHGVSELVKSREELSVELGDGGNVHGGGEAGDIRKEKEVRLRQRIDDGEDVEVLDEGRRKEEGGRRTNVSLEDWDMLQ